MYLFFFLGYVHCWHSNVLLELQNNFMVWQHSHITVSNQHGFFLYKNLPYPSSSSHSSTDPRSSRTTEPNKSFEHGAIQKDSVQCTVSAVDNTCLLSTTCYCGRSDDSRTIFISLPSWGIFIDFSLLKLVIKPDSLLLEDRRI